VKIVPLIGFIFLIAKSESRHTSLISNSVKCIYIYVCVCIYIYIYICMCVCVCVIFVLFLSVLQVRKLFRF